MDVNAPRPSAYRTRSSAAVVCVLLTVVGPSRTVLAQPSGSSLGPGTRVRIAISSTLTAADLKAMAGADSGVPHTATAEQTFVLQTQTGQELVLPAPGATFAGLVLAVDDQVVSIKADRVSRSLTVPRAAIAKLERADGRRSRARYAGLGALFGLGGGALLGVATSSCQPHEFFCSAAIAALGGGILGAGAGAVVGAIIPPAERWTAADVSSLNISPPSSLPAPPLRRPPRLTVTFQTGQPSSGPAHDIEQAMRAGGFADTSLPFIFAGRAYPYSRTGFAEIGVPLVFELDYGWRSWSLGFVQSIAPIGETTGYRLVGDQYLPVQYQVTTTSLIALRNYDFFRAGGGLAWHRAQSRQDPDGPPFPSPHDESWTSRSRVGAIAMAGIRLPKETRVFLDLSVQYRFLGQVSVGPYTSYAFGNPPATLQASDAQFSHWFVAFGPGIRF